MLPFAFVLLTVAATSGQGGTVEKDLVVTITAADLKGGIVTEVTWDGGLLVLQGAFTDQAGELKAEYLVVPAEGMALTRLTRQSDASLKYWDLKSNRLSPTGFGRITTSNDSKMPMYGVGSLEQRIRDANDMGGMQQRHQLRLGSLVIHERTSEIPPYDGETWSWSPAELNRVAYVDTKGDLWVARADGARPRCVLRGNFTLPAWSPDGRVVAVAERKDGGQRWEISVVHLPEELRTP
jgi:hypothetical protein